VRISSLNVLTVCHLGDDTGRHARLDDQQARGATGERFRFTYGLAQVPLHLRASASRAYAYVMLSSVASRGTIRAPSYAGPPTKPHMDPLQACPWGICVLSPRLSSRWMLWGAGRRLESPRLALGLGSCRAGRAEGHPAPRSPIPDETVHETAHAVERGRFSISRHG
jgi:hypothetical protein